MAGHLAGIVFAVIRCFDLRSILLHEDIGARRLALQDVADGDQRDDAVVLDVRHIHRALPHNGALAVFQLGLVIGIERGLIDRAAFDLREQPVADADDLQAQLVDIDGGDRYAIGIVARQHDAAGKPHQRRLVAQLDRNGLFLEQLVARLVRQALLQRDGVGGVEAETGDAQPRIERAHDDARGGINRQVILVMGAPGDIEIAGEDETGLRLRPGGVDLEPVKGEFGCGGHLFGRLGAGDGGNAVGDAAEEAGVRLAVLAAEDEEKAQYKNNDAGYGRADDMIPIEHDRPRATAFCGVSKPIAGE